MRRLAGGAQRAVDDGVCDFCIVVSVDQVSLGINFQANQLILLNHGHNER